MTDLAVLLNRVAVERDKQTEAWGDQHHASFRSEQTRLQAERQADSWKQINDSRANEDTLTWDGILLEEVYEAISEADPVLRVEELVQVAAVALAEAESIWRLLDELDEFDEDESEAA